MATTALPRIAFPRLASPGVGGSGTRNLLAGRFSGLAAAALLLIVALAVLLRLLGPSHHDPDAVRISLGQALRHAPQGWRERLTPAHAPMQVGQDMIRLSEQALPPMAGSAPQAASATLPPPAPGAPLPAAPMTGFFAPGPAGPLPIIARDGRTPFEVYRRPFLANGRPKVALVIGGLGLNERATHAAIESLPPEVTLSFSPYAEGLQGWIDMARAHGHEVLLETPMEPIDYPDNDPGPYTLMAGAQGQETVQKLEWILSRAAGYFGVTNYLGSRFLASDSAYQAFASAVRGRGVAFVDDGAAARRVGGMPRASAERVIDDQLNPAAIDQQLLALESGALQRGQALGSGFAYPVTLEKVSQWARALDQRGFQLAPASALVRQ